MTRKTPATADSPNEVPIGAILPGAMQPRNGFDDDSLNELAESIRENGIVQPLVVRPREGGYELIAGERRWRASQMAGLAKVPIVIRDVDDRTALELALVENLQRENLDPIEEAKGYARLLDQFDLTQEEIAAKVGKNRATVANALRLIKLPAEVQTYVRDGLLSSGHAKVILGLKHAKDQIAAAKRVINESPGFETSENQIIFSAVSPAGVPNVTAWEFSAFDVLSSGNDTAQTSSSQMLANSSIPASVTSMIGSNTSTVARSYILSGPAVSVVKYVGIATTDAYGPNERSQALNAAVQARKDGYDTLLKEHQQAWEDILTEGGDVQINNSKNTTVLAELQKMVRASWFHILSNLRPGNESAGLGDTSIAPAGLASDSYAEGIFWDADIWIAPGLLSLYPNFASNINRYRSKMVNQSIVNAQQANYSGLLYPWISFRYGNCTGIGPVSRSRGFLSSRGCC